jgi:hypothetical protein
VAFCQSLSSFSGTTYSDSKDESDEESNGNVDQYELPDDEIVDNLVKLFLTEDCLRRDIITDATGCHIAQSKDMWHHFQ